MASSSDDAIEDERRRVRELENLVQQERRKSERLQATQRTLEVNMSRLYEVAKEQVEERSQRLSAVRMQLQRLRSGT